jgi:hypothetical protein
MQIRILRVLVSRDAAPFRTLDSNITRQKRGIEPHFFVELRTGQAGTTHLTRVRQESCGAWIGWGWKHQERNRPASFERGGPSCIALILTMPVRTAATTMRGATASAVGSCSTATGMWGSTAAIAAAGSRVGAAGRSVRACLRRVTAIVGRRVSVTLWRVGAATASIGPAIGSGACTGPRRTIIPARGHSVIGRAIGAAEAVRGLAMISRIALCAPRARVICAC